MHIYHRDKAVFAFTSPPAPPQPFSNSSHRRGFAHGQSTAREEEKMCRVLPGEVLPSKKSKAAPSLSLWRRQQQTHNRGCSGQRHHANQRTTMMRSSTSVASPPRPRRWWGAGRPSSPSSRLLTSSSSSSRHPPLFPHAAVPPRFSSLVCWLLVFLVETVASQQTPTTSSSSSSSPYSSLGPYTVATARIDILATTSSSSSAINGGDIGVVPPEGEEGEVLVYYPTTDGTRRSNARPPRRGFPLAIYVHPTHGFLFETWTTQNAAMLRLLASRGVVVVSPVRVGNPLGAGPAAPIVGKKGSSNNN